MEIIKGRIILTHDIEANWQAIGDDFVPKAGELIVYDADLNNVNERFKIGDNKTALNDLKFFNSTQSLGDIFGEDTGDVGEDTEIYLDAGRI